MIKLVSILFKMLYNGYVFPFEKLNDKIMTMNEAQRKNYYQSARELLENPVFKDVLQESIRTIYQKLSVNSNGKVEQNAYRATLVWIKDFTKLIEGFAVMFHDNTSNPRIK